MLYDSYQRRFSYIRLSVTNKCNFSCHYCLPNGYQGNESPKDVLSLKELKKLLDALADLGVEKIRLTGGEPTIRPDFLDIAKLINSYPQIKIKALTTNGHRLYKRLPSYINSGLTNINISIDSLQTKEFEKITKHNCLGDILKGIDLALEMNIDSLKINSVLLHQINDSQVQLENFLMFIKDRPVGIRFIELMGTNLNKDYFKKYHVPASTVSNFLLERGWTANSPTKNAGPAIKYTHPDYKGHIGLIAPYSKDFCNTCNRLRITAQGKLQLCLFADNYYPLRRYLQEDKSKDELKEQMKLLLGYKSYSHSLHEGQYGATDNFSQTGG